MRRTVPFTLPQRILLLGRNTGLPLAITPATVTVAPGGAVTFSAAPGAGAGGVTITPALAALGAGATQAFTAEGS